MRPASQRPKGDAETKVLCPARVTLVPPGARHGCDRAVMNAEQASKPIVVGVDGSTSSIDALRYAARMASALNAPLEVLTVWSSEEHASELQALMRSSSPAFRSKKKTHHRSNQQVEIVQIE